MILLHMAKHVYTGRLIRGMEGVLKVQVDQDILVAWSSFWKRVGRSEAFAGFSTPFC